MKGQESGKHGWLSLGSRGKNAHLDGEYLRETVQPARPHRRAGVFVFTRDAGTMSASNHWQSVEIVGQWLRVRVGFDHLGSARYPGSAFYPVFMGFRQCQPPTRRGMP